MGIGIHDQLIENPNQNRKHPYGISSIRNVHTSKLHRTRNCALDTDAPPREAAPSAHSLRPVHPRSSSLLLSTRLPTQDSRLQRTVGGGASSPCGGGSHGCSNVQPHCTREKLGKPYPFSAFAFLSFLISHSSPQAFSLCKKKKKKKRIPSKDLCLTELL